MTLMQPRSRFRLTLHGSSLVLAISEVAANAICWIVAGIIFGRKPETRGILSLALLAWLSMQTTLGSSYVKSLAPVSDRSPSAIDNATRGLINLGQLPVTCGLFFSLGHSTIVLIVTIAIAISSGVFDKLHNVGEVGGIVGAAVSGSFLFIVGLANSIILWRILRQRRRLAARQKKIDNGEDVPELDEKPHHNQMLMMRILGPIMTFVNRPWKMYPVGVLFGFGFDTASSIALLALSAIAKRGANGSAIPSSHVVILPLLFTAGMTLVDSLDSILMLYSYSGFPEHSWALFERIPPRAPEPDHEKTADQDEKNLKHPEGVEATAYVTTPELPLYMEQGLPAPAAAASSAAVADIESRVARDTVVKLNVMSGLSIVLTLMSILVAFSISLITIMGLIGDQCTQCRDAAEAEDGGGLAGSWWRAWGRANDNSGYIGAAIVGAFIIIVAGWYGTRWFARRRVRVAAAAAAES